MPKKPDNRSCLKNIKMVKDEYGLDREIGEICIYLIHILYTDILITNI